MKKNIKNIIAGLLAAAFLPLAVSCSEKEDEAVKQEPLMPSSDLVIGLVRSGDQMLPDVIVTDGKKFTKTDKNGYFTMTLSSGAEYVYVVAPSGYSADWSSGVPEFWRKTSASSFDFNLVKVPEGDDYSFVVMADPQTKNEEQFEQFSGAPLADIVSVCKSKAAERFTAGICLGDVCQDAMALLARYKEKIKETGIPFYAVIGNHDFNSAYSGDKAAEDFKKVFGPLNYAFYIGKDLVIGLNSLKYNGNKQYEECYSEEVLDFVRNLLTYVPKGTRLYIAHHSPFKRWYEPAPIEGSEQMLEILEGYDVRFITGHTHVQNTIVVDGDMIDHNISGFLGAWWAADYCRDGTPRGYKIFENRNGELSWIFHTVAFGDDVQAEPVGLGQSEVYPGSVLVNVWDVDDAWSVKWSQGGAAYSDMQQCNAYSPVFIKEINAAFPDGDIPSYSTPSNSRHFFSAVPDLSAGKVTVEITNRFGRKWQYEIPLNN